MPRKQTGLSPRMAKLVAEEAAAYERRRTALRLRRTGMTFPAIGQAMGGISRQRAAQLATEGEMDEKGIPR